MEMEYSVKIKLKDNKEELFSFGNVASNFITSKNKYRNIIGPVGSGKDFSCYFTLIYYSDNFKYSRFLIIKKDGYEQFKNYFSNIRYLSFYDEKQIAFIDSKDQKTEFIFFDSLDTEEKLKKIINLELTGAFIETYNKDDEYNNHIINIVDNRIGRFPRLTKDTFLMNPPFIITNGYEPLFLPKLNIIFENYYQPNANSEKAENLKNLPKNFYNELSDLVDESYKNRFLLTDKGEK